MSLKFGGGRFLAEGSFPKPCLLLGGTLSSLTPPPGYSCRRVQSQL